MVSHKFQLRMFLFVQFLWYILSIFIHMWFCLYMCMHLNMYGCTCVRKSCVSMYISIQQVNVEYFFNLFTPDKFRKGYLQTKSLLFQLVPLISFPQWFPCNYCNGLITGSSYHPVWLFLVCSKDPKHCSS